MCAPVDNYFGMRGTLHTDQWKSSNIDPFPKVDKFRLRNDTREHNRKSSSTGKWFLHPRFRGRHFNILPVWKSLKIIQIIATKIYSIKFLNIAGTENWTNISERKENDWMSSTKSFVNMCESKKMDSDFGNWGSCHCETNCKIDKCKLLRKLKWSHQPHLKALSFFDMNIHGCT